MNVTDKSLWDTAAQSTASVTSELKKTAQEASRLGNATTRLADQTVREHPWNAIGVAAAIGFVMGLLVRRR